MGTGKDDLRHRTKAFALRVIALTNALPNTRLAAVIRNQLLRSGTSVGANYRAAKRAKSTADFISKMGTVEEETDESMYWMELIIETGLMKEDRISGSSGICVPGEQECGHSLPSAGIKTG